MQPVVKSPSSRGRVLPIVNEYAYVKHVVVPFPQVKHSSQAAGSTPILQLVCKVWTCCDLGRNKDRKKPLGLQMPFS